MKSLVIVLGFMMFQLSGLAQMDTLLIGSWKGSSLCQIKSSPCHDEQVVYHITRTEKSNEYNVLMNKIVNGSEEEMGTILFTFVPSTNELSAMPKPNATWKFMVRGKNMEGTLYYNGELYRKISAKKIAN